MLYESILRQGVSLEEIIWWIVFDADKIPTVNFDKKITINLFHYQDSNSVFGNAQRNFALRRITNGWVYFLDDDNTMVDNVLLEVSKIDPNKKGVVFDQAFCGGRSKRRRVARPKDVHVNGIDSAQYVLKKELIDIEWNLGFYGADGEFIADIYSRNKDSFLFLNKPLANHNYLRHHG